VSQNQRLTAHVVGRVQGVGYRWWTRRRADEMGLTGWVANDPGERAVDVVAEGPPSALEGFERALWTGPSAARVERVDASRDPASGEFQRFEITRP
jgi:acylphosphatase